MNRNLKKWAGIYFLVQGIAGLVWWSFLLIVPESRAMFFPVIPEIALLGFWLADFVFFIMGSLVCGFVLVAGFPINRLFFGLVAGGIAYASLYCLGLSILSRSGWIWTILMMMASTMTIYLATVCKDE